jgi:hypothetical protein
MTNKQEQLSKVYTINRPEGGRPMMVFRRRDDAQAGCDRFTSKRASYEVSEVEATAGTFEYLAAKLLAVGGERVFPQPEPHLDALLGRGQVFKRKNRRWVRGRLHNCHTNAALYYARHYALDYGGACEIVTGYGLDNDGDWSQHSWLWDGKRIIETNADHQVYFGTILTHSEARRFVVAQIVFRLPGYEAALRMVLGQTGSPN